MTPRTPTSRPQVSLTAPFHRGDTHHTPYTQWITIPERYHSNVKKTKQLFFFQFVLAICETWTAVFNYFSQSIQCLNPCTLCCVVIPLWLGKQILVITPLICGNCIPSITAVLWWTYWHCRWKTKYLSVKNKSILGGESSPNKNKTHSIVII